MCTWSVKRNSYNFVPFRHETRSEARASPVSPCANVIDCYLCWLLISCGNADSEAREDLNLFLNLALVKACRGRILTFEFFSTFRRSDVQTFGRSDESPSSDCSGKPRRSGRDLKTCPESDSDGLVLDLIHFSVAVVSNIWNMRDV
jgi:hypothetical protein